MHGNEPVWKPYKGCPSHRYRFGGVGPGRTRRGLIDTLGRRPSWPQGWLGEACERGAGEIPPRFASRNPKRAKPRGASSGRRANHASGARDFRKGQSPGTAAIRAGHLAFGRDGISDGETVRGFFRAETRRKPFGRGRLRRANPMSAAGAKQNRHGLGGRKPSRG